MKLYPFSFTYTCIFLMRFFSVSVQLQAITLPFSSLERPFMHFYFHLSIFFVTYLGETINDLLDFSFSELAYIKNKVHPIFALFDC
jgi:hypothetical protein